MRALKPLAAAMLVAVCCGAGAAAAAEVDAALQARIARDGQAAALIGFPARGAAPLLPLRRDAPVLVRRQALIAALRAQAGQDQAAVRAVLDARGSRYRSYWIANVIAAEVDAETLAALAARPDVRRIASDAPLRQALPQPMPEAAARRPQASVTWGLDKIGVEAVWAAGIDGSGVVIAGQDTGYRWDHPALKASYRGWDGSQATHDYNWHDAVHEPGTSCGADAPAPCDDHGHGTHTMGTMTGGTDSSGTAIGVAPGARWIGCRNMRDGWGSPARYIECMEWLLAPTDLAGNHPDPARAPDIVNNSWGCVPQEGCTTGEEVREAVENLVAGGIFFVAAAGNDGSSCSSINDAPATYGASFTVAATDSGDALASFSSRGPLAGSSGPSIDLAAPGKDVRSSLRGGGYGNMSGTSMAAPHVAGVAALVLSVNPALRGDPAGIAAILQATAERSGLSDPANTSCGGVPFTTWPNHQAGWGRLDAALAVRLADTIFADDFED